MKARFPIVAAGLSAVLLLASCSSGDSDTAAKLNATVSASHAPTTLEFWTAWTGDDYQAFLPIVQSCEKQYPWMTVKVVPKQDIGQASLAAVTAGNPPDAMEFRDAESLGQAANQKLLEPLDTVAARDKIDWSAFVPAAENMSTFGGKHYTLPYAFDVYALYYNKTLLKKAGFDQPPTTLADITTIDQRLTTKNADGSLASVGFIPDYAGSYLSDYATLWGAKTYSADGKTAVFANDTKLQQALEWENSFYTAHGAAAMRTFKASFGDYDSAKHPWLTGKVAMVYEGEWVAGYPARYATAAKLDWGVVPMPGPQGVAATDNVTPVTGNAFAIPQGSKHPAEAWALMKCMASDAQDLATFNHRVSNISALKSAISLDPDRDDPHWKPFLELAASSNATPPEKSVAGDVAADPLASLEESYLNGKVASLGPALKKTQSDVQSAIDSAVGP